MFHFLPKMHISIFLTILAYMVTLPASAQNGVENREPINVSNANRIEYASSLQTRQSTMSPAYSLIRVAMSPDSHLMAVLYKDIAAQPTTVVQTLQVWDIDQRTLIQTFDLDKDVTEIIFDPNSLFIATALVGDYLALWNIETGDQVQYWEDGYAPAFSTDGKLAFASDATGNYTFTIWSTEDREVNTTIDQHTPVAELAFSPNNDVLVVGSIDGQIQVWEVGEDELIPSTIVRETGGLPVNNLTFSHNGQTLVYDVLPFSVHVWDLSKSTETLSFQYDDVWGGMNLHFRDYGTVFAYSQNGDKYFINVETQETLGQIGSLFLLGISPDESVFVTLNNEYNFIINDVQTGEKIKELRASEPIDEFGFVPDGSYIVTANGGGMVQFWAVNSDQ